MTHFFTPFRPCSPMRGRRLLLMMLALSGILISFTTHAQGLVWARQFGDTDDDRGLSIAVDGSGNVYTTGYFAGTVDFDPGPATANLTAAGGYDIFVSKLDAGGNFVWARHFGGPSSEAGLSIAVDGSGNVYTTGSFSGTADFDPGPATANLTSAGDYDIFVSKLDAGGNFVWARQLGGPDYSIGRSIAVDGSGNVYTTGIFQGTVDFDPGPATTNLTAARNSNNIFVSKLDVGGNFVWARQLGGLGDDVGNSIAVDGSGNVYTTGYFTGTADFDPGPAIANLTSVGSPRVSDDIFVSKLDAGGNFVWARQLGYARDDFGNSIAVDGSGNVYTTGYFAGTVDFDPGPATTNLTAAGGNDIFVSKLDAGGNFVWARQLGGLGDDVGNSIAVDGSGNIYTTGQFAGTADFDPGPATTYLPSAGGSYDIFVSKLNAAGNFVGASRLGGPNDDVGRSIAVDGSGNVYTTGYFAGTADFDSGPATTNLTAAGGNDIFMFKLGPSALPVTLVYFNGRNTPGGNLLGWETAREDNNARFNIERSPDAVAFESIATLPSQAPNGSSFTKLTYSYLDAQPLPGTTYYRLVQTDRDGSQTRSHIIALTGDGRAQQPVLYPNPLPVNGEASIEPAIAFDRYIVSDALGRMVEVVEKSGVLNRVSLGQLPAGVYMLRIERGSDVRTFRLVWP